MPLITNCRSQQMKPRDSVLIPGIILQLNMIHVLRLVRDSWNSRTRQFAFLSLATILFFSLATILSPYSSFSPVREEVAALPFAAVNTLVEQKIKIFCGRILTVVWTNQYTLSQV